MTASSFYVAPGLPVLHSKDLVNWTIIGHGIKQNPQAHLTYRNRNNEELDYIVPRFGMGVYAPSLRYHDGFFGFFGAIQMPGFIWLKQKIRLTIGVNLFWCMKLRA